MASTSYGLTFKKASTVIGEVRKMSLPEISTGKISSTNASTGGKKTNIPSGVISLSTFSVTINALAANLATLYTDLLAGSSTAYTIDFPTASAVVDWTFNSYPTGIKVLDMDAQNPDVLLAEISFAVGSFGSFDVA